MQRARRQRQAFPRLQGDRLQEQGGERADVTEVQQRQSRHPGVRAGVARVGARVGRMTGRSGGSSDHQRCTSLRRDRHAQGEGIAQGHLRVVLLQRCGERIEGRTVQGAGEPERVLGVAEAAQRRERRQGDQHLRLGVRVLVGAMGGGVRDARRLLRARSPPRPAQRLGVPAARAARRRSGASAGTAGRARPRRGSARRPGPKGRPGGSPPTARPRDRAPAPAARGWPGSGSASPRRSAGPRSPGAAGRSWALEVGLEVDDAGDRHRRPIRASAASMAAAMSAPVSALGIATLAATRSSSGPRYSVFMWMTLAMPSPAVNASWIARTSAAEAPSPRSRDFVSMPSTTATATSSAPIRIVPTPSQTPFPVTTARHHAEHREHETEQRRGVLEKHDRQLRSLRPAHERDPALSLRPYLVGLADGGAQGQSLEHRWR